MDGAEARRNRHGAEARSAGTGPLGEYGAERYGAAEYGADKTVLTLIGAETRSAGTGPLVPLTKIGVCLRVRPLREFIG